MFRKIHLRFIKTLGLVVSLTFMFLSCDGRYRTFEKPSFINSVDAQIITLSPQIKVIPENNIISKTDTLLNANLKISVNYYSLENAMVTTLNKDGKEAYFREFESEIKVFIHDQLTIKSIISKNDFKPNGESEFWESAVLQYVWLDEFKSTKDNIIINCSFLKPNSNAYKSYKVYFNREGHREIKLIASS